MVDAYFGADTFRPALGRYIETFADGVADSPDFYKVIGEETNSPQLTDTFRTFVEQKGVPLLQLTLDCNTEGAAKLHVKQQRYKPLGSPIADSGNTWSIPFCLRSSSGESQCEFLTAAEQSVDLTGGQCPEWVLPNANGSGYYRFAMDEKNWQALLEQFATLQPTEQLTVIDSAFAGFEAGQLKPQTLIAVIQKSAASDKRQVVAAALGYLAKYADHYVSKENSADWQAFLKKLYGNKTQQLASSSDNENKLLYSQLLGFLALEAKDADTRKMLQEQALAFTGFGVERDPQALNSDLYGSALTVAVQDSGKDFVNHLIKARGEVDDPLFENASAEALGRVTDPSLLDTIHNLALSEDMGAREAFGLISNTLAEPALQAQNWDWLRGNFPAVVNKIPEQWRRSTPRFAASFCDREALKEVQMLFTSEKKLVPGYERAMAQTEESINLCIAQKEKGTELINAISGK